MTDKPQSENKSLVWKMVAMLVIIGVIGLSVLSIVRERAIRPFRETPLRTSIEDVKKTFGEPQVELTFGTLTHEDYQMSPQVASAVAA